MPRPPLRSAPPGRLISSREWCEATLHCADEETTNLGERVLAIFEREDRRWHHEAWAAREAEVKKQWAEQETAKKLEEQERDQKLTEAARKKNRALAPEPQIKGQPCLSCRQFHASSREEGGFCSECGRAVQFLAAQKGLLSLENNNSSGVSKCSLLDVKTKIFPEEVDAAVADNLARSRVYDAKMEKRTQQIVQAAVMPLKLFNHLLRSLGSGEMPAFDVLARWLQDLGHPLLSAAQAGTLLGIIRAAGLPASCRQGSASYLISYEHVLCSRVVDKWNLTKKDHGSGECYYGPDWEGHRHFNTPGETLLDALRNCGKSVHAEACWDDEMEDFVMNLISERVGDVDDSGHIIQACGALQPKLEEVTLPRGLPSIANSARTTAAAEPTAVRRGTRTAQL